MPPYADVDAFVDGDEAAVFGEDEDEHPTTNAVAATATRMRRMPSRVPGGDAMTRVGPAPRWVAPVYLVLAVLLIPWIVYLGAILPDRTTSAHWDVAWVGFDVMEFLAIAMTGWFAYRRSKWVEVAATAAAVLLVVDAWFDITTAHKRWDVVQALVLGIFAELPLAVLSVWVATRAARAADSR